MSRSRWVLAAALSALALPLAAPVARAAPSAATATVVRDEYGVPHVYAGTARALFYGDGHAQAHDRLWQADLVRRTATGTLSALVGAGTGGANVASDTFFRLYTGGTRSLRAQAARLDAPTREAAQAFVDGVNAQISSATAHGSLPLEYAAAHAAPAPWTVADVLAVGMLSTYSVGTTGADELHDAAVLADQVRRLGQVHGRHAFDDSHWLDDPSAPTTIPAAAAGTRPAGAAGEAAAKAAAAAAPPSSAGATVDAAASARALQLQAGAGQALEALGLGGPGHSNAVLLSGRLTATGHPMLLGGPQIGYSLPQGFVEIGLHGAGYDATGVTLAGLPGVLIGTGHGHAWTVTTGGDDVQDLYVETVDPAGHPGQYSFDGRWRPYDCRDERVGVAGSADVLVPACESVHGPVLSTSGSTAVALRDATRGRAGHTQSGFLALDRATSMASFLATVRTLPGSLNLWYADSDHIAYQRAGRVPLRPALDNPFLPHPGDGSDEWSGFLPADQLPSSVDPAQGYLVNWNNKPQPGWRNATDGFWQWGPAQRVQVLQRRVSGIAPGSADVATLEDLNRVAGTTAQSPPGTAHAVTVQALLPPLLEHVRTSADPRLAGVRDRLRAWTQRQLDLDRDGRYDNPSVAVYDAWYRRLVEHLVVPVLGNDYDAGGVDSDVSANVLTRLLQGRDAALHPRAGYLDGTTLDRAVTGSLVSALDDLTAQYGTADTARWLRPVARTQWSPLGAGAVQDTPFLNRGTYNQIVSLLPSGPRGENVVAPGQSGDLRSPHFGDQLKLYAEFRYKPMRLTRQDLTGHTTSTLVLPVPV